MERLMRSQKVGQRRSHRVRLRESKPGEGGVHRIALHPPGHVEHGFAMPGDENASLNAHGGAFLPNFLVCPAFRSLAGKRNLLHDRSPNNARVRIITNKTGGWT